MTKPSARNPNKYALRSLETIVFDCKHIFSSYEYFEKMQTLLKFNEIRELVKKRDDTDRAGRVKMRKVLKKFNKEFKKFDREMRNVCVLN